jgi:hypothetical protein
MHLLEKARATGNSYRALLLIVVLQCWSASALASPNKDVWIDENTDGLDFHGSVMIFIDSLGGIPPGGLSMRNASSPSCHFWGYALYWP